MSAVNAPTRRQVLSLYKQFIKSSSQFSDYNFREYFLRRSRDTFKSNKDVNEAEKLSSLFDKAKEELGTIKRQAVISQMYTFDKLVVEPLGKAKK